MHVSNSSRFALTLAAVALLGGCDQGEPTGPALDADFATVPRTAPGAVFTMTDAADANAVVMFSRGADGMLSDPQTYYTGGMGNGGGLGNQGSIVVSEDRKYVFVVNAGSDDVSSFAIRPDGLELVDREWSGGTLPVSLTTYQDLVYVVNDDDMGPGSILGFRIEKGGDLTPVSGSAQPLSGAPTTAPAQIAFSRDGRYLAVAEKATNLIDIYTVNGDGVASSPNAQPSAGATPFGLGFGLRDQLIVSEASGGAPGQASASSYNVTGDGTLSVATGALGNTQTAACWAAVTPDGRLAYTANTPSNTISGYWIAPGGSLSLVDADGVTGQGGAGDLPKDLAFSHDGRYLYALNVGTGTVGAFAIGADGGLTHVGDSDSVLPGSVNGIAAW